eukprot:CFRG7645T1
MMATSVRDSDDNLMPHCRSEFIPRGEYTKRDQLMMDSYVEKNDKNYRFDGVKPPTEILQTYRPVERKMESWSRRMKTKITHYTRLHTDRTAYWLIVWASFITRLYHILIPATICWDETHFGKFASYYIKGTFYFDVHPPLGKMLLGLVGYLTGYDGQFAFEKPGVAYEGTRYEGMRIFCGSLGACVPPMVFLIMQDLGFGIETSCIAALLLLFDTGTLTLSRYILLDPILLFFVVASMFSYCRFTTYRRRPFSYYWWKWLTLTGVALACAMGVKWVGLFIISFIGISVVMDLWDMIGDLSMPVWNISQHFFARAACLIVLPIIIYISFFAVHFQSVKHSGPGDGFMSSAFQTSLIGNKLHDIENPHEVAFGSLLTIKSNRISGALLHSHIQTYPKEVGPAQQQVTTYSHKDHNNDWIIKPDDDSEYKNDVRYLRHGDLIRLQHSSTGRNLHSHKEAAPITTKHKQVTCYGNNGKGDINDVWRLVVAGSEQIPFDEPEEKRPKVKLITTKFRLVHKGQKCWLHNGNVQLPKWGFDQGEVTCKPGQDVEDTYWNIESIVDDRLPKQSVSVLKPSFWYNLMELHFAMINANNNLKPKVEENTSKPWHWPILYKGQHFSHFDEADQRIYLMGNPVVFYGNIIALFLFCLSSLISVILDRRGFKNPLFKGQKKKLVGIGGWIALCFVLHYIPFFLMGRVLYFHHYFPAHVFACILSAIVVDEAFFWTW